MWAPVGVAVVVAVAVGVEVAVPVPWALTACAKPAVVALAGGRVYTGREARAIGLVDEMGGLQEAMAFAAKRAGLEEYKVRILPEPKTILDLLREALGLDDDSELKLQDLGGAAAHPLLQAAWPLLDNLDPERRAVVVRGLRMAEMLTREAVLLVPPFELTIY